MRLLGTSWVAGGQSFNSVAVRRELIIIRASQIGRQRMATLNLRVNGADHSVAADDPKMPLLYALRDGLGLHGPKFGCGLGQCGACTVIIAGEAVRSCQKPVADAVGQE